MALSVTHAFVSGIPDIPADALIGKVVPQAHWNAAHAVTGNADPNQGGTGQVSYSKGDILASPGGAVLDKIPVGVNGQVLTADSTQTDGVKWASPAGLFGRVTGDVTFTSTITLALVTGLSVAVVAGRTYGFRAVLFFTDAAAGGIKATIFGSATATAVIFNGYVIDNANNGVKANTQAVALNTTVASTVTTGTDGLLIIEGTIQVNVGGTLQVLAAQNTSNVTPTTIKRGSTFILDDIT